MKRPVIISLAILLIVLLLGGGYMLMNRDDNDSQNTQNQTPQTTETQAQQQSNAQTEGTLDQLTSGGNARQCDISYSGEKGQANGTIYTDGKGRARVKVNAKTEEGKDSEVNTLVTKQKAYLWFTSDGKSMGFSFDVSAFKDSSSDSSIKSYGGLGPNDKFSMNCQDWSVDEALLTPPKNVDFTAFPVPTT